MVRRVALLKERRDLVNALINSCANRGTFQTTLGTRLQRRQ